MPRYAEIIGDPVAHSLSPALHSFWLKNAGLKGSYCHKRISVQDLKAYFDARRNDPDWAGCNLTAPLKEKAVPQLDALSDAANAIGAVNIVRAEQGRLIGD